ncbi:MAG: carboxymuconolactone decarboxylase family protein [Acidimicrobiales bacterium]|nr:carboxymuconolactone decarboxylase family protein [Acidimicrobiales bacterium]
MARLSIPAGDGSERRRVWSLRPDLGEAVGALNRVVYDEGVLPVRERELARMRVVLVNGCPH